MMKGYNYTIVHQYKEKTYIPILDVTFHGKGEYFLSIASFVSVVVVSIMIATLLNIPLPLKGILIILLFLTFLGLIKFLRSKNGTQEMNEVKAFYYRRIKKYQLVITHDGNECYLPRNRKEERIYVVSKSTR